MFFDLAYFGDNNFENSLKDNYRSGGEDSVVSSINQEDYEIEYQEDANEYCCTDKFGEYLF